MKKCVVRLMALLVCVASPSVVSAQFVNFAPAKKFVEVDVHAFAGTTGILQNNADKFPEISETNTDNGLGLGAGAGAVFGFREWLGLGTEFNLMLAHNKLNMAASDQTAMSMSNVFVSNRYSYINIPVYLSFRFNALPGLRWSVDAGIYYSYGISGRQHYTIYNSTVNELGQLVPRTLETSTGFFKNNSTFLNSYYRSDVGLHLASNLQFGRHIFVGARFQIGMKNIAYITNGVVNPSVHNLTFTGVVGYKL